MTLQSKPAHLVERAAKRLREMGSLGGAGLLSDRIAADVAPVTFGHVADMPPDLAMLDPAALDAAPAEAEAEPAPIELATLERAGMIGWGKKRERIAEEFRIAQSQILRNMEAAETSEKAFRNLVMVTSARPGEGKSFSALNLAASIARYGDRPVLLVDADAKRNSLSQLLGLADAPGLLELGIGRSRKPDTMTARTRLANLSVLPIGGGSDEPRAEMSARVPIVTAIERIARRFERSIIILDAPPCLASSEPSMLAPLVGQIVMVVEAERTRRNEVEAALDLVQTCPTITLLLNKTQLATSDTFGAYYY